MGWQRRNNRQSATICHECGNPREKHAFYRQEASCHGARCLYRRQFHILLRNSFWASPWYAGTYGIDIRDEINELKGEIPIAPLSDDLVGPAAARLIMNSALDLGYKWQKLNKFISGQMQAGLCKCSYGCPYGAKWTARNFVAEAISSGADLINGAKVTKVIVENNSRGRGI